MKTCRIPFHRRYQLQAANSPLEKSLKAINQDIYVLSECLRTQKDANEDARLKLISYTGGLSDVL